MFTCFAELLLSGTVLILTSLHSKTKANQVAVAASIMTILGKYQGFMVLQLCFSSSTDVLLLHAFLKTPLFLHFVTTFLDGIYNTLGALSVARLCL